MATNSEPELHEDGQQGASAPQTPQAPIVALVPQQQNEPEATGALQVFASRANFAAAQRIAMALAASTIVPKAYQGQDGLPNCLVALELAARTGASVMMVMQNLHVIQGRPSWSASFLIASVNSCGRFSPLRYVFRGVQGEEDWGCRVIARDLSTGEVLEGEWITWEMARKEGWTTKAGSKWMTMPGQMMRYRAASFWTRTFAPEISLGMQSAEEVYDVPENSGNRTSPAARSLNDVLHLAMPVTATVVRETDDMAQPSRASAPQPAKPSSDDAREVVTDQPSPNANACTKCGGIDGQHTQLCPFYPKEPTRAVTLPKSK